MNPAFQGPQHDKQRYLKISASGGRSSVICEPLEASDWMDDEDEYVVTDVWMSPAEYESLPEFMGF